TNAQKAAAEAELRRAEAPQHRVLTPEQIEKLISALGGLVSALNAATPEERREVYRRLGIRLTYHPGKHEIRVEANLDPDRIAAPH
ncbi:hypothetical protein, partial [Actinomadura sp. NBRC 104425]|uniref:hypothetical protein n=1 Tax=Actinomadura sp. NBRC 104425 TaxID=3032204 RepID=UPI002555B1CF